jgi:hypothetical protein
MKPKIGYLCCTLKVHEWMREGGNKAFGPDGKIHFQGQYAIKDQEAEPSLPRALE